MKSLSSLCILLALASGGLLKAQVYSPDPLPNGAGAGTAQAVPSPSSPSGQAQPGGTGGSSRGGLSDIFFLDPTTDVFSFDGKSFNVSDNRLFRARFEKYLNSNEAESEEDLAYRKAIRQILDTLTPHNREANKLPKAVAQLQYAGAFPQDAYLCESLSNAIYRVFLAQQNQAQLRLLNEQLDRERRQLDWTYDSWKKATEPRRERKLSENPDTKETTEPVDGTGAGHMQRYVQRIVELEQERLLNSQEVKGSEIGAKVEFQALIVQFFFQRRFEHVLMATRFYTEFFKDGRGKLAFNKDSEVEQSFSKTIGFNPTITTLEAFASEAIRDVKQSVESFNNLIDSGEIDGATRQLQQAFVLGEHLPNVQSVPRSRKEIVKEYALNSFQLVNAIEVKDYGLAETLVEKMKAAASDFDHSKPTAAIETAKLSSNMRIRTAKNAALKGDHAAYEENIKAATEIWPQNPLLKEQFDLIADSADVQEQAKIEFDRLLGTQSYRQIFTNRARFIAATVDDKERQRALEQIIGNIQEIETVMKQAETLSKAGNAYAAWEIIEKTFQRFPDDVPLSSKRSDLSTDVAPFVKALKNAENQEARKQFGSSLAWFLSARQIYPQSEYASEGIKRIVDQILPEEVKTEENQEERLGAN